VETSVSGVRSDAAWSGRLFCWVESLILGLGVPAGIWVVSRLISLYVPAAVHGSREQRFLFWILGGVIVEWSSVLVLWFVLRTRKSSFRDLGVWQMGSWAAWTLALLIAFLSIASNLRFLPRMHIPVYYAFMPHGFHLVAALLMGTTAGFCEEVLFRGFLMTDFLKAGYGKGVQVFIPGLAFGLSHAGFLSQGFLPWLGIAAPVAFIGMMWGVAYLLGRRSLVPAVVAHFLNDATALPWIMFFMITSR
jgi:membrane protease YdiL (CAAX protease family)